MQKLSTKYSGVNAYVLNPWEKIPEEMMTAEHNGSFFICRDKVLKIDRTNFRTLVAPSKEYELDKWVQKFLPNPENFKKQYKDQIYYVSNCIYHEMSFIKEEFLYVMAYFRKIHALYKTESAVILLAHPEKKLFKPFFVLQYDLAGGLVRFIRPTSIGGNEDGEKKILEKYGETQAAIRKEYEEMLKEGWIPYGTMHSHCDMNAFHSNVDDTDEFRTEGLHITLGKVSGNFDISYRIIIEGVDFKDNLVSIKQLLGVNSIKDLAKEVDGIEVKQEHIDLAVYEPPVIQASTNEWRSYGRHGDGYFHGYVTNNFNPDSYESWEDYMKARYPETLNNNEEPVMVRKAKNLLESVDKQNSKDRNTETSDIPEDKEVLKLNDIIFDLEDILLVEHPDQPGRIIAVYQPFFEDTEEDVPFVPLEEVTDFKSINRASMKKIAKIKRGH